MLVFRFALMALLAGSASLAWAQSVCDDVHQTANGWNEIADNIASMSADGLTQQESDEIGVYVAPIYNGTFEFAEIVAQHKGTDSQHGQALIYYLQSMGTAPNVEQYIAAIDNIVAVLDKMVQECDLAYQESGSTMSAPPSGAVSGSMPITYTQPPQGLVELATMLRNSGRFEAIAGTVSSVLNLPTDIPVTFAPCGQPNAFYHRDQVRITMCYELFAHFANIFVGQGRSLDEAAEAVLGAGGFIFLHEIGHALVHVLQIPITGREEDSVDNLATLILIDGKAEAALFAALENFAAWADQQAARGQELAFWGEHSLSAQRVYDVACLMYGSNPNAYAHIVAPELLPEQRAVRCPSEYQQKSDSWDRLLAPYMAN